MTPEVKQLISDRTKIALADPDVRARMEQNNYIHRRKQVKQFTLDGKFVAVYCSASSASRVTGVNKGNLCACCRGCFKQAGGFKWRYVNEVE